MDRKRKIIYHYLADLGLFDQITPRIVEPFVSLFSGIDVRTLEDAIQHTTSPDYRGQDISIFCPNYSNKHRINNNDFCDYDIEYLRCYTYIRAKDEERVHVITGHLKTVSDDRILHTQVEPLDSEIEYWYESSTNDGQHRYHNLISPFINKNSDNNILIGSLVDNKPVKLSKWSNHTENTVSKTWKLYSEVI